MRARRDLGPLPVWQARREDGLSQWLACAVKTGSLPPAQQSPLSERARRRRVRRVATVSDSSMPT
jgi:hypothetical protein